MDHLAELLAGDLALVRIGFLLDEGDLLGDVAGGEEQEALGGQAVASGAPGLLVIALGVLRQIVMDDEADVRLIDAHAEGDGGADDLDLVAQEALLVFRALLGGEPGVVGTRADFVGGKLFGEQLGRICGSSNR